MEIVFKYDIERLRAYSRNEMYDNRIDISDNDGVTKLMFPEVGYFNYSFSPASKPLSKIQVDSVIDFYREGDVKTHKIIVLAGCEESKELLCREFGYEYTKTIVKTSFPINEPVKNSDGSKVELVRVEDHNIYDFTCAYLKSFESEQEDYRKVEQNFRQLLGVEGLDLFLVVKHGLNAGVNVLYKDGDDYLLAGGAILKEFRSQQFHKHSMLQRIKHSLKDTNLKAIYSSAYKDSISVRNMLSINMDIAKAYDVYEYNG